MLTNAFKENAWKDLKSLSTDELVETLRAIGSVPQPTRTPAWLRMKAGHAPQLLGNRGEIRIVSLRQVELEPLHFMESRTPRRPYSYQVDCENMVGQNPPAANDEDGYVA